MNNLDNLIDRQSYQQCLVSLTKDMEGHPLVTKPLFGSVEKEKEKMEILVKIFLNIGETKGFISTQADKDNVEKLKARLNLPPSYAISKKMMIGAVLGVTAIVGVLLAIAYQKSASLDESQNLIKDNESLISSLKNTLQKANGDIENAKKILTKNKNQIDNQINHINNLLSIKDSQNRKLDKANEFLNGFCGKDAINNLEKTDICPLDKLNRILQCGEPNSKKLFESLRNSKGITCDNYISWNTKFEKDTMEKSIDANSLSQPVVWTIDPYQRPGLAFKYTCDNSTNIGTQTIFQRESNSLDFRGTESGLMIEGNEVPGCLIHRWEVTRNSNEYIDKIATLFQKGSMDITEESMYKDNVIAHKLTAN